MTHNHTDESTSRVGTSELTEFVLPLVSVIIVNFNYGRFLADAVSSVFAQTYKRVECFVVDNNSTDNSREVLEELSAAFPELHVQYRVSNDGQCVASAEVFPETKGQYVVFLDADDVLMPECIGTHVYVALSLYAHVGFTCSDMYQAVGNEIVLSTSHSIKQLILGQKGTGDRVLRPFDLSAWPCEGLCPVGDNELQYVGREEREWHWTATSAFMFRRDAIDLFIHNPRLKILRCALDVYFARGINAVSGSVLINRPLCIYRMHGSNIFSRHAHLDRCLNFELGGRFDQNEMARRELVDLWLTEAPFMIKKFRIKEDFLTGIQTLNDAPPRLTDERGQSYAAVQVLKHFDKIREVIGLPTLMNWCMHLRVSPLAALRRASLKPALRQIRE